MFGSFKNILHSLLEEHEEGVDSSGWRGDSVTRSHEAKSKLCLLTACETKSVSFVAVSTQLTFGNHRENLEYNSVQEWSLAHQRSLPELAARVSNFPTAYSISPELRSMTLNVSISSG